MKKKITTALFFAFAALLIVASVAEVRYGDIGDGIGLILVAIPAELKGFINLTEICKI